MEFWEQPPWVPSNRMSWAFTTLEGMLENGCGTVLMRRIRSRTESCGGATGSATRATRGARSASLTSPPRQRATTAASAWPEGVHKQSSERSEGSGWRESRVAAEPTEPGGRRRGGLLISRARRGTGTLCSSGMTPIGFPSGRIFQTLFIWFILSTRRMHTC